MTKMKNFTVETKNSYFLYQKVQFTGIYPKASVGQTNQYLSLFSLFCEPFLPTWIRIRIWIQLNKINSDQQNWCNDTIHNSRPTQFPSPALHHRYPITPMLFSSVLYCNPNLYFFILNVVHFLEKQLGGAPCQYFFHQTRNMKTFGLYL